MIILFARLVNDSDTETELVADEDWDVVKRLACKRWNVQNLFDHHQVWEKLRHGDTVLINQVLYCRYDAWRDGGQFSLFQNHLTHVPVKRGKEPTGFPGPAPR